MAVLARMRCNWVQSFAVNSKVNLTPVYTSDESDPHYEEIKSFNQSTPSGTLEMTINNGTAAEQIQPGEDYYVSIERIPKAPA